MTARVLIVGSGAAGTAAAWSLARHDGFEVEVWEAAPQAGGVATSEPVTKASFGADWINDGVQGGAPTYRNTAWLHRQVGFEPRHVDFRVSFGRGETAWNNTAPTALVRRLQPEIARFDRWLDALYAIEPLAAVLPIHLVLRLGRFSADFRDHMLFPLVALFFGTGNQTRRVSSALVARLFKDPPHYQGQLDRSVYQTIFLDRDHDGHRWTKDQIDPDEVLYEKPWIQFSHTWQHYARVVPFLRFLQGHRRCYYAGSWTLANTHEIATISGVAAAHRLGAPYPITDDPLAREQFETYLRVAHGQR